MPKVLIVDNNITIRTTLVHQLDKLGIRADSAANGFEAVRRIRNWHYELILMAIQMPEMDGLEATAAIRAHEKVLGLEPVPIIAISSSDDKDRAIAMGMNDYFEKPALLKDLQKILDDWLPLEKRTHWDSSDVNEAF